MLNSSEFFSRVCEALNVPLGVHGTKALIAKKLNVSKTAVGNWEKGEMPGTEKLSSIIRISELSNTSLHWLLTGEGNKFIDPIEQPKEKAKLDTIFEILNEIEQLPDKVQAIESLEIVYHEVVKRLKLKNLENVRTVRLYEETVVKKPLVK